MSNFEKTAIVFCDGVLDATDLIDFREIINYAEGLPKVKTVWDLTDKNTISPEKISQKIKDEGIERLVLAGVKPGLFKSGLARAMVLAGKDPDDLILADFSEHSATSTGQADRAKAVLYSAHAEVPFSQVAGTKQHQVKPETVVIGAGIAGIQASLEIANSGNKVYLVERSGTIGGHMAMFDKTFPTLDCAACILTPKMVEVGQHPNIELLTYSQVKSVTGDPGDFKIRIHKKARRVDLSACIGCGICTEKCPAKAPSEFDAETTLRKAIYIPFPQAVPNKYLIDEKSCLYCQTNGEKCGVCVKFCPANCINLDEKDEEIEIVAGNIIVASGFKPFDARKIEQYGYGKIPNVLTSLEFERLVNAAGPTGGEITYRTKDKKGNSIFEPGTGGPDKVAIIHCIGSRDENYNKFCSRVCCMYSLKLAHLVIEKLPNAEVLEYYIDMRAFGKGYEEFYDRIKEEGVKIIRGRTAKIEEKGDKLLLRTENIVSDTIEETEVDMAILSIGLEPGEDAEDIGKMLNIQRSADGWFQEKNSNIEPVETFSGGIYIAGVCQGPKDIPDTVAQASAAASKVLQNISRGTVTSGMNNQFQLKDIEENLGGILSQERR